jgi:hypothetical protein
MMVARPPLTPAAHRELCGREFAVARPTQALDQLAQRPGAPRLGEACVALADLSSSWEVTKKKPKAPKPPVYGPAPAPATRGIQANGQVDAGSH